MRHPTEGTLRRLVDEPAGVPDPDRAHVAGCSQCLSALAAVQQDAAAAGAALGTEPDADVERGWHRLSRAVDAEGHRRPAPATARRWHAALRSPALAAVGVAAVLTGAGAAAAADWLPIFRTQEIAPVTVSQADLVELPDLSAYGDLEVVDDVDIEEVTDVRAAERASGLSVPRVADLPRGVSGDPVVQVGDQVRAVFTFSADEARQVAADSGETLPPPPPGLDGSRFRLVAGPGVAQVWSSEQGLPALIVARAVAPTAASSGVPFSTARDYLLSLPGLPEDVAAQLRRVSADGTTLPLPVPAEEVTTSDASVHGVDATVFESRDGALAGVVWVEDGIVTAVAGSLSADEVLAVAEGLEPR